MANYELLMKRSAAKELEALPAQVRKRIARRIQSLGSNAGPPGSDKLSGQERYRLRQGDYRILYEIDDDAGSVTIVKIGHRRDVYR